VPGRQADGFLQEGELRVVEAEDLVYHMGLGLHSQAEHSNGLATTCSEQDLQKSNGTRYQDRHMGLQ
jgi:hypothetical protein